MQVASPQNDFQYIAYIVGAIIIFTPSLLYFTYLKFGKDKNNDYKAGNTIQESDITRIRELLAADNERLKSLEASRKELWSAITGINDTHSEFSKAVIRDIGEIVGEMKANGSKNSS